MKRRHAHSSNVSDDEDALGALSSPQKLKRKLPRSPSTSPPPEPPPQEHMRDGYAKDDAWIMVEDEFLQTARLYTQHLHHAEYQRLKAQAKMQRASAIQSIVRPVTNPERMSGASKMALDGARLSRRQQGMIGELEHGSSVGTDGMDVSDDDQPIVLDPHLEGLMTRPVHVPQRLSGLASAASNTRAAAGFTMPTTTSSRHTKQVASFEIYPKTNRASSVRGESVAQDLLHDDGSDNPNGLLQSNREGDSTRDMNKTRRDLSKVFSSRQAPASKASTVQRDSYPEASQLDKNDPDASENRLDATLPRGSNSSTSKHSNEQRQQDSSAFSRRIIERRQARKRRLGEQSRSDPPKFEEVPTFLV
ncbi:MAG: hypothetical protein M1821_000923 [Bathelium mastoideum]|nr:MAG: hypothetical protein M1821_000923 [Bathelium mastoideum]